MTTRNHGDARPFRLGFLSHGNGYDATIEQTYAGILDTIEAADRLGYDAAFLAQHHFGHDSGRLPSPLVLLAAAAQRTRTIHLGTGISTVPLEDPLRFAEDLAVLDALSGGRVEPGLGSAKANIPAFPAFGVPFAEAEERYDAAIALLHTALEGGPIRDSGLRLQPEAPGLRRRLWQATSQPEKAERIARAGDGLLIGTFHHRPDDEQRRLVEAYLGAWDERHAHGTEPRIGAVRAIFPAEDRAAALADLSPGLARFRAEIAAGPLADTIDGLDDHALAERINIHYGSVDEVVESLRADEALLGIVDLVIPVVQHEASTPAEEIRRLEIIATQIAPRLGWAPAARLEAAA